VVKALPCMFPAIENQQRSFRDQTAALMASSLVSKSIEWFSCHRRDFREK
jgi:hypothetical protein